MMKVRMAEIWQPRRGVSIQEISPSLFMFKFFHAMDMQKVLKGCPWSFDRHLLILGTLQPGDIPHMIPLFTCPFWIQIHNIPPGFMSLEVGQQIGNHIGVFLEYDEKNNMTLWQSHMRIRVLLDVRVPLQKDKRIRRAGGAALTVIFKYERLGIFCFFCGVMGHLEDCCDSLFALPKDDGKRHWNATLRADNRNGGGSSRWLQDESGQDYRHDILSHAKNPGFHVNQGGTIPDHNQPTQFPDIMEIQKRKDIMAQIFQNIRRCSPHSNLQIRTFRDILLFLWRHGPFRGLLRQPFRLAKG
uniref:Uncharacterized protein At4g02000 family n=1 Tax=Cajanus cajan TaxID=3821 RepID=A0A151T9I8_CAJCA|nr:Uncharacterized protein At4g02000 family [Cajanus cajan]